MQRNRILIVTLAALAALTACGYALANDHSHGTDNHEKSDQKHDRKNGSNKHKQSSQFIVNKQYNSTCGSCHWAYIPQLLPSESWDTILSSLNNHFGSEVPATDQELSQIKEYLLTNSADKTDMKIGRKITKSLGGKQPLLITDIPYIQHKHNDIPQNTFTRKSIKSLANCISCHPSASTANFDDDNVKIPTE